MTIRSYMMALAAAALIAAGGGTMAETNRYALPLDGRVTAVETSALSDERNAALRAALERRRDIAARVPGMAPTLAYERVLAQPDTDVLHIRVRFAELPQRAMEPVLLVNDQPIGHPVGSFDEVEGGVEVEFLVLPQLAGGFRVAPDLPLELAVQMGEDRRTRSVLRSEEAVQALRAALAK